MNGTVSLPGLREPLVETKRDRDQLLGLRD